MNVSEVRKPFENDVVALLQKHGVEATPSHAKFSFDEMKGDKEQIRQRFVAANAESVLFVRVTDRADFASGPPVSLGDMDMGAVDESRYNALTRPGGDMDTTLRIGARLYRVSDGAVIWTGLLSTMMKEDYDSVVLTQNIAKTIVDQMAKDKVIP
jgi:hypothetical protein